MTVSIVDLEAANARRHVRPLSGLLSCCQTTLYASEIITPTWCDFVDLVSPVIALRRSKGERQGAAIETPLFRADANDAYPLVAFEDLCQEYGFADPRYERCPMVRPIRRDARAPALLGRREECGSRAVVIALHDEAGGLRGLYDAALRAGGRDEMESAKAARMTRARGKGADDGRG